MTKLKKLCGEKLKSAHIIRPNIYYYDFPYEHYEDIIQEEFNNLINNDDVELIILFKNTVYSTNIEYINNCFIKERDD